MKTIPISRRTKFRRVAFLAGVVFVLMALGAASQVSGQNFAVNSTADLSDQTPGDGKCNTGRLAPNGSGLQECTLRAAIQEANASTGFHQITVPAGTFFLTQSTSCSATRAGQSQVLTDTFVALCITGQMTIQGAGASSTIIDAGRNDRVAVVGGNAIVEIEEVTLQNGKWNNLGFFGNAGGCIINQGNLTLSQSVLSGNMSPASAGAIYNVGTLDIESSTLVGNTATQDGGAIFNDNSVLSVPGTIVISNSTISNNGSPSNGGGIMQFVGSLTITESTLSGNSAGSGGAIFIDQASLVATNTTIAGNQASAGGGIENADGTVSLNGVTIAQNISKGFFGGGVFNGGPFTLENTILGENTVSGQESDCDGDALTSKGHNLVQHTNCAMNGVTATNITGSDPLLGSLAANGGPTQTLALLADSPALNAGDPSIPGSGGTACAATDQRGFLRPQGAHCDIGAFETVAGFTVSAISPIQGGSGGTVTGTVSGSGFVAGASVALRRAGQTSIVASPVAVDEGQAALTASFNLTNAAAGSWDLIVTNPNQTSATLPAAFSIGPMQSPAVWVDLVGRSAIRAGLPVIYTIVFGNRGNVDAAGVPLTLSTPSNFTLDLLFPIVPPPFNPVQALTNWTGVPTQVQVPQPGNTNVPLLIPVIPAGYTGTLNIQLELPPTEAHGDTFTIQLGAGNAFFNPGLDPAIISQFVAGAQDYSLTNFGVKIPAALTPNLTTYFSTQLQTIVANGRNDLVRNLGAESDVLSESELLIDLAAYGAMLATSGVPGQDPAGDTPNPCKGMVLAQGSSCGDEPTPEPTPGSGLPPGCSISNLNACQITATQCMDIGHQVSSDGKTCLAGPGCNSPITALTLCRPFPIKQSVDPNDKIGPMGVGSSQFTTSLQPFSYDIAFENQATATAPAQQVTITDQLDATNLDLSTFSLGPISFGKYTIVPPSGLTQYVGGLDLRPAQNVEVKVQASLNKSTGLVTWVFQSIDPTTGQLTTDPLAGFLPPDVNPPAGMGSVVFSARPKQAIATNTTTCNQGKVVFDFNAAINTPTWCNTFDNTPPVSHVTTLPATETSTSLLVQWSGTDVGAGIFGYSIYVSDNGGPFNAFQTNTTTTSAMFTGQLGHTYGFYSIATDLTGNVEGPKTAAEATTTVTSPCATDISSSISVTRSGDVYNFGTQRFYQTVTLTNNSSSTISGPVSLVLEGLSSNASLFNASGNTTCAAPLGSPYINVTTGSVASGASVSVVLQFKDPTKTTITYSTGVLAGSGTP
jgi:CSLREA domain-containing protein